MSHECAILKSITGESVPLQGVRARGAVNGLLFELDVTQRYRNESPTNIEVVYTFPLPHGAVLLDVEVRLGEKTLVGVVVEKRAATTRYEDAIEAGDTAVLLEQAANGLCAMSLGNLMAGESASIRYRYAQLLRFEQGSVRLAIATVIAPRYGDAHAAGLECHQVPQHDLVVAYPFELSVRLDGVIAQGRIMSPSHAIATKQEGDGVEVALAKTSVLDRDFVLTIDGLAQRSLAVVARDGDGCVALASFCAEMPSSAPELPLTLKLLVDCSGSMGGDSMAAARRALHRILAGLHPADRFTLSRFGGSVVHDVATPCAAAPAAIRRAADGVAKIDANLGGTEMAAALRAVFALGRPAESADVLLITDGEIWNAEDLIAEARRARQRIFVVGIGAAPAEGVLRRLAEATQGACEFVAPGEEAEAGIVRMFGRLRGSADRARWPCMACASVVEERARWGLVRRRDDSCMGRVRRGPARTGGTVAGTRWRVATGRSVRRAAGSGRSPDARARRGGEPPPEARRRRPARACVALLAAHGAHELRRRARACRRREGRRHARATDRSADAGGGMGWLRNGARGAPIADRFGSQDAGACRCVAGPSARNAEDNG